MSEKKGPGKLAHAKGTQKSAKSTTKQAAKKAAAHRRGNPLIGSGNAGLSS
jgi:hypothetical protein